MNNIEELKKVALAATPGPWEKCDSYGPNENGTCISAVERPDLMIASTTGYYGRVGGIANTHFIALANPAVILDLIAQLEAAQKEPKETQEKSDIQALRNEAANIIGLLTAEGHQTFTLDTVADFFDDVFRKFEAEHQQKTAAEAALSAANEKLSKPVVLPDGWRLAPIKPTKAMIDAFRVAYEHDDSYADHWIRMLAAAPKPAGFTVEGDTNPIVIVPAPAGVVMRPQFEKPLERCAAARDGECHHKDCPQLRDNEPMATGRHCPIDNWDDE